MPIKDVVIGTEESYIRYSNWLQVYYLFVLFKVVCCGLCVGVWGCCGGDCCGVWFEG